MLLGGFETDQRVLVVAEIGNNHEGDFTLAQDLIGLAAEAGAHAVKFQTFRAQRLVSRRQRDRFACFRDGLKQRHERIVSRGDLEG